MVLEQRAYNLHQWWPGEFCSHLVYFWLGKCRPHLPVNCKRRMCPISWMQDLRRQPKFRRFCRLCRLQASSVGWFCWGARSQRLTNPCFAPQFRLFFTPAHSVPSLASRLLRKSILCDSLSLSKICHCLRRQLFLRNIDFSMSRQSAAL